MEPTSKKFLRVPVGQTFDRLRFALPFFGAPKGTKVSKVYRFCCRFVLVPLGNYRETVRQPCLFFPAVKVYDGSKKIRR